jgi:hypothetical protein
MARIDHGASLALILIFCKQLSSGHVLQKRLERQAPTPLGKPEHCPYRSPMRRSAARMAALRARIKEGGAYDIKLARAVPVFWVYLTGRSNGDGPANFRNDVYNIDNVGEAQVSAQAAPVR